MLYVILKKKEASRQANRTKTIMFILAVNNSHKAQFKSEFEQFLEASHIEKKCHGFIFRSWVTQTPNAKALLLYTQFLHEN